MNAKLCIRMDGPTTYITEPETGQEKPFTFDFSYWSHDGFRVDDAGEMHAENEKYATQRMVYENLGKDVLNSAFEGYNSCLFAYGQTGSGKSYSMVGYGKNRGIIPIVCEEMFRRIGENEDPCIKYEVVVSMLEIYNECVKDLLNPKNNPPDGLKIRSHKEMGVYVDGLLEAPVASYDEIEAKMAEGTLNRSVASTKMNATSSRAHTVFSIVFCRKRTEMGLTSEVRSRMNLVDLAGSERTNSTGATGDRLKEGCAINTSLSALGNVISALADLANGKKKVFVPYRNSVLTRLLQDALGGNSKTIMVCALSPADVNFDETISTLRYASRAKQIKNKVTKNENPTDRIIQALKEENARLIAMLGGAAPTGSGEEVAKMKAELEAARQEKEANDRRLQEMMMSWEEKLALAKQQQQQHEQGQGQAARDLHAVRVPYLVNLHQDAALNECVMYTLNKPTMRVGKADADPAPEMVLAGLNVRSQHAVFTTDGAQVRLAACEPGTKLFVNGSQVGVEGCALKHLDRVIMGNNFVFRFNLPADQAPADAAAEHQWVGAQAWAAAMDEYQRSQGLRLVEAGGAAELEKEESAKTKELEAKLAAMEAELNKQRESQASLLVQQEQVMMQSGLSDAERKWRLEELQLQHNAAVSSLERRAEEERAVTVRVMQQQVRKKRQEKKLRESVSALLPLVEEANAYCEELRKPLRFEAQLGLVLDVMDRDVYGDGETKYVPPTRTIKARIRVTNKQTGAQLHWKPEWFEERMYLMRDLYQEISERRSVTIPLSKDPLWAPPERMLLGHARIVLKALSQFVEIDGDAPIISEAGKPAGSLNYEIQPLDEAGEEHDYLSKPEEALGKHLRLRISVNYAKGLSLGMSERVIAQGKLFGHELFYEAHREGGGGLARFDYKGTVDLGIVDQDLLSALKSHSLVLEVLGYSPAQVAEIKQGHPWMQEDRRNRDAAYLKVYDDLAPKVTLSLGGSSRPASSKVAPPTAAARPVTPAAAPVPAPAPAASPSAAAAATATCGQCGANAATVHCGECAKGYCDHCAKLMHKAASRKNHALAPIGAAAPAPVATPVPAPAPVAAPAAAPASPAGALCQRCESSPQAEHCAECGKTYCVDCARLMHKAPSRKDHVRTPVAAAAPAPPVCVKCGSAGTKRCVECAAVYCDHCEMVMHKAASRREHTRIKL
jgi:hypothetical protein